MLRPYGVALISSGLIQEPGAEDESSLSTSQIFTPHFPFNLPSFAIFLRWATLSLPPLPVVESGLLDD